MSAKASKLLEDMRRSTAKWKRKDLVALYTGFGFTIRKGSKHDIVSHPDFPQLVTSLPRHRKLGKAYVVEAVRKVDQLLRLKEKSNDQKDSG